MRFPAKKNMVVLFLFCFAALLAPEAMAADPGVDIATRIFDWLTGPLAKISAAVVAVTLGIRAWGGHMQWSLVLYFIGGCILVFGAKAFVALVTGT